MFRKGKSASQANAANNAGNLRIFRPEGSTIGAQIERERRREVLRVVHNELSESERLIVLLHYFDGLTVEEIGDVLSLPALRVAELHGDVLAKMRGRLGAAA